MRQVDSPRFIRGQENGITRAAGRSLAKPNPVSPRIEAGWVRDASSACEGASRLPDAGCRLNPTRAGMSLAKPPNAHCYRGPNARLDDHSIPAGCRLGDKAVSAGEKIRATSDPHPSDHGTRSRKGCARGRLGCSREQRSAFAHGRQLGSCFASCRRSSAPRVRSWPAASRPANFRHRLGRHLSRALRQSGDPGSRVGAKTGGSLPIRSKKL
jgi:hypothetical protein